MHLGMTGRFVIDNAGRKHHRNVLGEFHQEAREDREDHLILNMSNGGSCHYNDPRRFGST